MTSDEIQKTKAVFARYGVPADRIFNEIMRAHYLDYALFQDPNHVQYGVSQDDLYESMKKTADKLGMYEGDAETYARMYTLALQVDPMPFAPGHAVSAPEMYGYIKEACATAERAGVTLLFAGAEGYLSELAPLFNDLGGKRIAVVSEGKDWQERLHLLFPRGRSMVDDELSSDPVRYNYIFNRETKSVAHAAMVAGLLAKEGTMDLLIPYELLQEDTEEAAAARKQLAEKKTLAHYYDGEIGGKEFAFLRFSPKPVDKIGFGEAESGDTFHGFERLTMPMDAFIEAEEWNYDLYAYNGSEALQMLLSGNIVDMEYPIGAEFAQVKEELLPAGRYETLPSDAVEDYGVRSDLVSSARLTAPAYGRLAKGGDLVLAVRKGDVHAAVVEEGEEMALADDVFAFRTTGAYTAEYLKLYLDGAVGSLFLATMKTDNGYHLTTSRILRIPFPKADKETVDKATASVRAACVKLADAAEDYRKVQRDGVSLMMSRE